MKQYHPNSFHIHAIIEEILKEINQQNLRGTYIFFIEDVFDVQYDTTTHVIKFFYFNFFKLLPLSTRQCHCNVCVKFMSIFKNLVGS